MMTGRRWLLVPALAASVATPRVAAAATCFPGFNYAAFGDKGFKIGGGALTDSYDSSLGAYTEVTPDSAKSGGNIGTNGTICDIGTLNGASTTVGGNIQYGPTGSACTVNTGSATVTGTETELTAAVTFPPVIIPETIGSVQPTMTVGGDMTISASPNNTYNSITVNNNKTLTLAAGTYIVNGNLTVKGTVAVAGPVVIYFSCTSTTDAVTMNGGGVMNPGIPQQPGNLVLMLGPNCTSADFTGGANASFAVYGPTVDVDLHGGSEMFGAIVGKSITDLGGVEIHYDKSLAAFDTSSFTCASSEVSRAQPVVADITPTFGGAQTSLVQGTFVPATGTKKTVTTVASISSFTFPYITGHMRARIASTIGTTASDYSGTVCTAANTPAGCSVLFDAGAAGKIPSATGTCTTRDGSCRYIFTNTNSSSTTGTTFHPTVKPFTDANVSFFGALATTTQVPNITDANRITIMGKVRSGSLGGVDRSTVAVIGASTFAGGARPTMAYFGATDGMLHAVCASNTGICTNNFGKELWAFLPRVQLPMIITNDTRIDGSVRVSDVFGDFTNDPAIGTRSWRTILTFQTGSVGTNATAAAYALDITDPANPTLLWEYTAPSSPSATDFGIGLVTASGRTLMNGQLTNAVVLQTRNGGSTTDTGTVVTALSQETGKRLWQFTNTFPNPPRGDATDTDPLPWSGVPGGAVGVDLVGSGFTTDYVFGDLYGSLWLVDAATGLSRQGVNTPLFSFTGNKHPIGAPPAIYSDGNRQFAAFVSGGYTDPTLTSWTTSTQYIIAVKLDPNATTTVTETTSACMLSSCRLSVNTTLTDVGAAGDKGFAQALVVGNQLFVMTDTNQNDVNSSSYGNAANTGHLTTVDLTTGAASTTIVVNSGASSLVNNGTTLYSASATKQQQMATGAASTTGSTVDIQPDAKGTRNLWLRTE